MKYGDLVQMRTGGPPMKVIGTDDGSTEIYCSWTDDAGQLQAAWFPKALLTLIRRSV